MSEILLSYDGRIVNLVNTKPLAIPFDILYNVVNKQGEIQSEVPAHKFLLTLVSLVFRTGFFGSDNTDKKAEVIKIKETTSKAFQTFINVIYQKPVNLDQMKVHEILEVFNLANHFIILELLVVLNEQLDKIKITKDNVI